MDKCLPEWQCLLLSTYRVSPKSVEVLDPGYLPPCQASSTCRELRTTSNIPEPCTLVLSRDKLDSLDSCRHSTRVARCPNPKPKTSKP